MIMETKKIEELFSFQKKSSLKASEGRIEGKFPFYTSSGTLNKFVNTCQFEKEGLIFPTGGMAGIHYNPGGFSTSSDCFILYPKDQNKTFVKFYYYYLFGNIHLLEKGFKGAGLKHISKEYLSKLEVPILPIKNQIIISNILDHANNIIQKNKDIIFKYSLLTQSVFIKMFGDPRHNNNNWPLKSLPEFISNENHSIKRGPYGGSLKKEIFVKEGYLVYEQYHAINDDFSMARYFISDQKYKELKAFKVKPGDLIVSCSGVTLGRIAQIPENAKSGIINQALLKISLDYSKMNPTYFKFLFRDAYIQDILFGISRGSGMPNFPPMPSIKAIKFMVPPINLQNNFNDIIKSIEKLQDLSYKSLRKSEELFQSLFQRAFKGEL